MMILINPLLEIPIVAATATATEKIRMDIISNLRFGEDASIYIGPMNRPNLEYIVESKDKNTVRKMAEYISNHPDDKAIIFGIGRAQCEKLCGMCGLFGFRI
jgi:ATP-dependent DNA helicase RecQ